MDTVYCEFIGLLYTLRVLNNERTPAGVSGKGLLNKLNNQDFLSELYMMKFMLLHLTVLSKTFQKGVLNFSQIAPNIEKIKFKINQVTQQNESLNQLQEDNANHLPAYEISINEEKIKMITRQNAYSIHKKRKFLRAF